MGVRYYNYHDDKVKRTATETDLVQTQQTLKIYFKKINVVETKVKSNPN